MKRMKENFLLRLNFRKLRLCAIARKQDDFCLRRIPVMQKKDPGGPESMMLLYKLNETYFAGACAFA